MSAVLAEPASDLHSEQMLLIGLILDQQYLAEALTIIAGSDAFWSPDHAQIWLAIIRLHNLKAPISPDSVMAELRGTISDDLPRKFFMGMRDEATFGEATSTGVPYYARIVNNLHQLRNLSVVGQQMVMVCRGDTQRDAADVAASAADQIAQAVTERQTGTVAIGDACDDVLMELCAGKPAYLPTPWPKYDAEFDGIASGCVTTVMGTPSSGKTTWCLQLVLYLAGIGVPTLIVSNEQNPKRIAATFLSMKSGVQVHTRWGKGDANNHEIAAVTEATLALAKLPISQVPHSLNAIQIYHHAKLAKQRGIKLVMVDYLQQLPPMPGTNSDRERIAESMKMLARIRDMDMTVLLVSQIDKATSKGTAIHGDSKRRPTMFDGLGAAEIEQASDWMVSVFRPHMHEPPDQNDMESWDVKQKVTEISVLKAKFGSRGNVTMRFDPNTMSFGE